MVNASARPQHTVLVDDHVVADDRVFNCAVVVDLSVVPDYASSDCDVLANAAVRSDDTLFNDAVLAQFRVATDHS